MSEEKIYAALTAVMAEVGHVAKSRKNPQQGYQFRGIDDLLAATQHVMAKHGVVCVPCVIDREREYMDTKSGGKMASVRLLVRHTFYASDGSSVECVTLGEAMDSGDKASNKAMSAALKYALIETLLIPTYEPERDTEEASHEITAAPSAPAAPPATIDAAAECASIRAVLALCGSAEAHDAAWNSGIGKRIMSLPGDARAKMLEEFKAARRNAKAVTP